MVDLGVSDISDGASFPKRSIGNFSAGETVEDFNPLNKLDSVTAVET